MLQRPVDGDPGDPEFFGKALLPGGQADGWRGAGGGCCQQPVGESAGGGAGCAGGQCVTALTDLAGEIRPAAGAESRVLPGYTEGMKTAISVPDDIFNQATQQAADLGISRSEFFTRAARRYLDELASHSLTEQVNDALQAAASDDSAAAAAAAGRKLLAAGDDW